LYSEECAKLSRQDGDRVAEADSEMTARLTSLELPAALLRFKKIVEGDNVTVALPADVKDWMQKMRRTESEAPVAGLFAQIDGLKSTVAANLALVSRTLDDEMFESEEARVRFSIHYPLIQEKTWRKVHASVVDDCSEPVPTGYHSAFRKYRAWRDR
jgi:hypothetical protein